MTDDNKELAHRLYRAQLAVHDACMLLVEAGQQAHTLGDTDLQHKIEEHVFALMQAKDWANKEWGARCLAEQK